MRLKLGQPLASATDTTTVLVVKAPDSDIVLTCGGTEMVDPKTRESVPVATPGGGGGTVLGKRYVDDAATLELLCTKGGDRTLAMNGRPLSVKPAKLLPASD
jgi:hypothetical protein